MRYLKIILPIVLFSTVANYSAFCQSRITAIEAKLFYNERKDDPEEKDVSGTFSENIIDNSDFALWNIIIGAGSAEGYSKQTIVIVEVTSKGQSNKNQVLKFTSIAGKKTTVQQRTFASIGDQSKYKLLFLLNDTGCETIKIKAELIRSGKPISTMNKSIRFECGE